MRCFPHKRNVRRCGYTATFVRLGSNRTGNIRTALLVNICHKRELMARHVWIVLSHNVERLHLQRGEQIAFTAEVERYRRRTGRYDYTLTNLLDVRRRN